MSNATAYLNAPVRNCQTCVHCDYAWPSHNYDHCMRWQFYCTIAATSPRMCEGSLTEWRQRPPARNIVARIWRAIRNDP
jgi:hypothetical protein